MVTVIVSSSLKASLKNALAEGAIAGSAVPMGPGWSAARMQETGVGSSRLAESSPRQALQHAPPSTLSSAWERLVEKREAGRVSFEVPHASSNSGTGVETRSQRNTSAKSGSPVKAKARLMSWCTSLLQLTLPLLSMGICRHPAISLAAMQVSFWKGIRRHQGK